MPTVLTQNEEKIIKSASKFPDPKIQGNSLTTRFLTDDPKSTRKRAKLSIESDNTHLNICRIGHLGLNKQLTRLGVRPVLGNGIFLLVELLHDGINSLVCADELDGSLWPHALDAVTVVTPQQDAEVDELKFEMFVVVVVVMTELRAVLKELLQYFTFLL